MGAIEEFERVNERYTYLTDQRDDVEKAKKELEDVIAQRIIESWQHPVTQLKATADGDQVQLISM